MQKLTVLGLFLSCFEIQNVLGLWEDIGPLPPPDLTRCSHLGTAVVWSEKTKIFEKDKMLVIFFSPNYAVHR